jgi:hypothetical protein
MTNDATSHKALRILLVGLGVILVVGGFGLMLAAQPLMDRFSFQPWLGGSLSAPLLEAIGAMAAGLSYFAFKAAGDPRRNVAIVEGLALLMLLLAIVDVATALTLPGPYAPFSWVRAALRLGLAAVLLAMRPR